MYFYYSSLRNKIIRRMLIVIVRELMENVILERERERERERRKELYYIAKS